MTEIQPRTLHRADDSRLIELARTFVGERVAGVNYLQPAGLGWVSDAGVKGVHEVEMGVELATESEIVLAFSDGRGGIGAESIRLRGGTPSQTQVEQALSEIHSNPYLRADLIAKARSAMGAMNRGDYGMAANRAAEMNFLIKALEKLGG